jgi:protein SCO1
MNKSVITALVLMLVASGSLAVWSAWRIAKQSELNQQMKSVSVREAPPGIDEPILTEFTLTERSGRPFGSRDLEGDVWVASFFFSVCPGSCRTQNLHVQSLQSKFAKKGVKFVSITCDPRVDTPERLAEYAAGFQAKPDAWYFLTGEMPYIRRIGAEFFQIFVDERGHLDRFMTVDKWGNVRGYHDWVNPAKLIELEEQLDELLAESEPPAELKSPPVTPSPAHQEVESEEEDLREEDLREEDLKDGSLAEDPAERAGVDEATREAPISE